MDRDRRTRDAAGGPDASSATNERDYWRRSTAEVEASTINSTPLHRYCKVLPRALGLPYVPGKLDPIESDDDRAFYFLDGVARVGLQYAPVVLLGVAVVLLVGAAFDGDVSGLGVFLPPVPWTWSAIVFVWLLFLLGLVVQVGLIDEVREVLELVDGAVVYGSLVALGLGTALSVVLVVSGSELGQSRNVVFVSGYLFTLLLGAMLVYDGMLRTETLFANVESLLPAGATEKEEEACAAFVEDLRSSFGSTVELGPMTLRTATVFAVVFVLLPAYVWYTGSGPQNLSWGLSTALNVVLDLFIVVVAFQFLVLNRKFSQLISDTYVPRNDDGDPVLTGPDGAPRPLRLGYDADHEDGRGGYGGLGKFATRVNAILLLAGLYVVYRLYVQGGRALPLAGSGDAFIWVASYVLPVAAYGLVALVWLYYSFWRLHRKMATERSRTRFEDGDPRIEDAPVWPVGNGVLASLVSANAAPVLLAAPRVYTFVQGLV